MNNLEAREAFERNKAEELNMPYDEFKRRTDEYERITGHRYGPHGQLKQDWLVWTAKWNACNPVPKGYVLVPDDLFHEIRAKFKGENAQIEAIAERQRFGEACQQLNEIEGWNL